MYRLAYRNFGSHESLVVNHSVAVGSSGGIRWYEIQQPNATPTVVQQSTFAPDSNFRWMGSVAMDQVGDLAVGYSLSSSSMFPSVAFAGRVPSDPASTLEAETNIVTGTGSQTGLTRWGDYSALQVDPEDECTFWYTTEYLRNSGTFNWNTRIAKFNFPKCVGGAELTVNKVLVHPWTQSMRLFNLQIDGITVRANVNGGSSGPQIVSAGKHTVGETGGTGTGLGAFFTVIGGDCADDGTVSLAPGESKTCTITNYDNYGGCKVGYHCSEPGDGKRGCLQCTPDLP